VEEGIESETSRRRVGVTGSFRIYSHPSDDSGSSSACRSYLTSHHRNRALTPIDCDGRKTANLLHIKGLRSSFLHLAVPHATFESS